MKNKASFKIIALSSLFATLVMVGGSLSWFAPTASVGNNKNPITGEVEDEYYASGTGTSSDPYVITKPRHLYNLAWLQYLGFYNKNTGVDNHQFYFKLGANIDMGEFSAIPPIGSELNPFVGNFNGQGYVVSNVTISNSFSDYTVHPSAISGWNDSDATRKQPHILGFFGIIGEYPGGNKNSEYSSAVNEFVNTGISGANIKTVVTNSLVGMAAGYVRDSVTNDNHNVLKNVVVDDSKITLPTSGTTSSYGKDVNNQNLTNISDYSLVGYTNDVSGVVKASKSTYGINIDTNIVFSATEEGNTAGWGGSVNMYEMYTKLDTIWKGFKKQGRTTTGVEAINYYANKEVYYNKDGNLEEDRTVESNSTAHRVPYDEYGAFSGSSTRYHSYYNYEQTDSADSKTTASYGFIIEEQTSNEEDFMCLSGNKEVTIQNGQSLTTHYYDTFYGQKISKTINGTPYYLKVNGTNDVTATSNPDEASLWKIENDTIYTSINDTQYFLNRNGTTTVNIGTTSNTTWNYNSTYGGYYTTYNNTDYYLNCATTDWNLVTANQGHILLSDGNNHYITHPSTDGAVGSGTNANDQNAWWYADGDYYKATIDGTYYLRSNYGTNIGRNTTSTQDMYVSDSTDRRFYLDGGYLYTTYYSSRYHYVYAYYNGTSWRETVATGNRNPPANRTPITVTNVAGTLDVDTAKNITLSAASTTPLYIEKTRNENVDAKVEVNHTYFPLRQVEGKAGVPDETNTGYVVSGGNYWGDPYGDIRVSRYSKSTYLSGGVGTVYTIDASGRSTTITNSSSFKKFDSAKSSMQTVLNNNSNVYGLHFMDASIHYGGTNPVIVEKAVVNGDTYYNYELPTDCVDFHLKENGYINFFAGTYYTGNSCFFSLHEVIRNGSTISNVKEIKGVYQDASDTAGVKSYSYLYSDGKYSVPFKYLDGEKVNLDGSQYIEHSVQNTCPTGYTLAFDTFRITNRSSNAFTLTTNSAYYFEIPMNEGEYCLGSVSGRNGAYLMYLDIAANAAKTNRTVFYEKFTLTQSTYSHPTGVSLGDLPASSSTTTPVITTEIDDSDSACMVIMAAATGVYIMERSGNDVALTRGQENKAPPNYCGDTIDLIHNKGSSAALTVQAISSNSYVIKQVEYYDYMIISDTLLVTRITDYSTDGGSTYTNRTITQIKYGGNSPTGTPKATYVYDASKDLDQRSDMRIYNHNNNGKRVSDADLIKTTVLTIPDNKLSSTVILVYKLFQNGGDAYDDVFAVVTQADSTLVNSGTFFTYNGMTITLTPDSGSIIVKVTDYTSTFTIKVTNITTNSSSNKNVNTSITINGTAVNGSQGQTITITAP